MRITADQCASEDNIFNMLMCLQNCSRWLKSQPLIQPQKENSLKMKIYRRFSNWIIACKGYSLPKELSFWTKHLTLIIEQHVGYIIIFTFWERFLSSEVICFIILNNIKVLTFLLMCLRDRKRQKIKEVCLPPVVFLLKSPH